MSDQRRPAADGPDDASGGPPAGGGDGERLVGGRYRLGPLIGRGGMATIHRATDVRLGRDVALKLLRPEVAGDLDLAQRFRREALAATVLRHPNIVACLDTGQDGHQPYLVMDLIEGEDLAARLHRGGRLAPWQAARIGLDVARALGVAHVRGVVHRDVKPGNILLAADGRAMVTDFGIARLAMDAEAALPGTTLGSVHYFSPEQARGATTIPASDVYGLGLVLYEALTGQRAWTGATTDAIALARIGQPAPSPRAIRPEVPAELDAVVRRALAPDAGDRYPNGAAMAAALQPIVAAIDPASPTAVVQTPVRGVAAASPPGAADAAGRVARASAAAAGTAVAGVAPRPGSPARDGPAARSRRRSRGGRPAIRPAMGRSSRSGAPRMAAILTAVGVLVVALVFGAASREGDPAADPEPSPTTAAHVTSRPTPRPTPTPTAMPTPSPEPTPTPDPTPTPVPAGEVADVCEIFFDLPCGLGPGRYGPSRFDPPFDIELAEGWSTAVHREDVVSFSREEGLLTFAGVITEVFDRDDPREPRARARDLMEAFIATDGVSATRPVSVRIGDRRGLSADLTPIDSARVALFSTAGTTFYLEADRTTRIVVIDLPERETVLLAIEPGEGRDLADILALADPAAGTIRWR